MTDNKWGWSDEIDEQLHSGAAGCRGIVFGALLTFAAVCVISILLWVVLT